MVIVQDYINNFNGLADETGVDCVFFSFSRAYSGTEYDDSYPTASGTGVSGIGIEVNLGNDSDRNFLAQGAILINDKKLIVKSSVAIDEMSRIDIGTSGNTYSVVKNVPYIIGGSEAHKTLYVRKVTGAN